MNRPLQATTDDCHILPQASYAFGASGKVRIEVSALNISAQRIPEIGKPEMQRSEKDKKMARRAFTAMPDQCFDLCPLFYLEPIALQMASKWGHACLVNGVDVFTECVISVSYTL